MCWRFEVVYYIGVVLVVVKLDEGFIIQFNQGLNFRSVGSFSDVFLWVIRAPEVYLGKLIMFCRIIEEPSFFLNCFILVVRVQYFQFWG